MRPLLLVLLSLIIFGCAPMPTQSEMDSKDYGEYPENYQEIVQEHISQTLIDPDSARFSNWRGPSKGWAGNRISGYEHGWRVCVNINAKNRMGGYTGAHPYFFIIRNNFIVLEETGTPGTVGASIAQDFCNGI